MMSETSLPKVSILMATYNGAAYLIEQLDSLRAQDYPHFDLLVCDDVSTDDTLELLKRYQQQYPDFAVQLRVVSNQSNVGYIKNFERGLSYCQGEYLFFCDQDDIWLPSKLSTLVAQALKTNALAVYSNAALIDASGADLGIDLHRSFGVDQLQRFDHRLFLFSQFYSRLYLNDQPRAIGGGVAFP